MTEVERTDCFVVWAAGSERQWYSCLLGVFDAEASARELAEREAVNPHRDPGDVIYVQGLRMNEPDLIPEDVWKG